MFQFIMAEAGDGEPILFVKYFGINILSINTPLNPSIMVRMWMNSIIGLKW